MLPSGFRACRRSRCDEHSRSQWRDRAGFSPASLHQPWAQSIRGADLSPRPSQAPHPITATKETNWDCASYNDR